VFVGTSGWTYKDWAEAFFPAGLPAARQFRFYATRFSTVEINASFYRLPTVRAFQTWKEQAPPGFIYSVKGSRAVTHFKRIEPGAKSFDMLLERVGLLEEHLGPILWQLPGSFRRNASRLAAFLDLLPTKFRHAIEFRHPSWLDDEIFGLLRAHKVACVSVSSLVLPFALHMITPARSWNLGPARSRVLSNGGSADTPISTTTSTGVHPQTLKRSSS
jgi:uncharacterized protein YecE (DUF72 family)